MSDINTNKRLFDLVRYQRSELHGEGLITDEEYFWLCAEADMAKGGGSPSPRRLEDYDEKYSKFKEELAAVTVERDALKAANDAVADAVHYELRAVTAERDALKSKLATINHIAMSLFVRSTSSEVTGEMAEIGRLSREDGQ